MLGAAGLALQQHLKLGEADQARLAADLDQLQDQAGQGELMGYGRFAALHLLLHAIRSRVVPRRQRLKAQIDDSIHGLESLLSVEWRKSDESIEPRQARDSVGPGGGLFDPLALSAVMDHSRGTRAMAAPRRERIEQALAVLRAWRPDPVLARFVHLGSVAGDWLAQSADLLDIADPDPCARATALFDEQAARLAEVFGAVRIARLEIDGIYDAALHDPWFANFHWQGFSSEELLMVPAVIALENADRVAGEDLRSFSQLLSSGRPVQIWCASCRPTTPASASGPVPVPIPARSIQPVSGADADADAGPDRGASPDPFQRYRTELGYLGLSHRQAAVSQTSAARHEHLMQSYLAALDATCTSLHLINTGLRPAHDLVPLNAWLVAGAAIEGRAHPFFRVDPTPHDCEPPTMDFGGNPQPEADWPVHPFTYLDDNGNRVTEELAFTFADYCLLVQGLREHFRVIPPGCDSEALIPMQAYLAMHQDDAYRKVPFLWAVDANGVLHRLVVSRRMAVGCLDRLNYWRTLQAMAGVRNRHVDQAVQRTRDEERQRAADERERLLAAHAAELEQVRNQAAGEAMQRLTDRLLGMDLAGGAPMPLRLDSRPAGLGAASTSTAPANRSGTPTMPPSRTCRRRPARRRRPPKRPSLRRPLDRHAALHQLQRLPEDQPKALRLQRRKAGLLGDLGTATFAQLVEAAELCPAKCIHPGRPWNPDEPDWRR